MFISSCSVTAKHNWQIYTPWTINKRATLFLIITLAFLVFVVGLYIYILTAVCLWQSYCLWCWLESRSTQGTRVTLVSTVWWRVSICSSPTSFCWLVECRLGLSQSEAENESSGVRLNAVHVHGVNDMSTQDVFDYFAEFAPTAVEWIDDSSCMSASLSLSVLYSAAASHIRPSPSQSYFMWRWSLEIEWTVDFHENQTRCSHR